MTRAARALLPFVLALPLLGAASPRTTGDAPSRDGWSELKMEAQAVLGELKLSHGDLRGARGDYARSLEEGARVRGPKSEVAAQGHYRSAELALGEGEYGEARRHLELLIQRYPETDWSERARRLLGALPKDDAPAAAPRADAPFVAAMAPTVPEEALARLRAALDDGRVESGLAEAHDFLRRHPGRREVPEVELAAAALHLRRGEAARAVRFLKPLLSSTDRALRAKAAHLLGAALTAVGLDDAILKLVPAADPASARDRWTALSQAWRAGALARAGKEEAAGELYRAIAASGHASPLKAYALGGIAADWDRRGKPDRALDALSRTQVEAAKWGLDALAESAALSRAHLLQRGRRLEEAQKAYGDFARRRPESPLAPQALYHRGLCLKRLGREEEAVAAFEELTSVHPGSAYAADAHLQLGQLHTELGRAESAMTHYRKMAKASEAKDADREALLLMAQVHYNAKRWAQAAPLYRQWLEGAPDDAKSRQVAGLLLVSVWHADRDSAELPALAARVPNHPLVAQIRWDLAAAAYKKEDWAAAEELFRLQIEAAPRDARAAEARFLRAEALRRLGRADDAAAAYRRYLDRHPGHARRSEAAMRLGGLLYEAGDARGAAAAYARVDAKSADAPDAAYNRALALAKDGGKNAADAWGAFAAAHPRHPKASWAWWQSGRLAEDAGDAAAAARAYARAGGADERVKALYALGRVEEKRKRPAEAKAAYAKLKSAAPAADPARLAGLLRLALMLELEDKPREAAPLYAEVLKSAPRGEKDFETARARLEAITSDKSLLGR